MVLSRSTCQSGFDALSRVRNQSSDTVAADMQNLIRSCVCILSVSHPVKNISNTPQLLIIMMAEMMQPCFNTPEEDNHEEDESEETVPDEQRLVNWISSVSEDELSLDCIQQHFNSDHKQ